MKKNKDQDAHVKSWVNYYWWWLVPKYEKYKDVDKDDISQTMFD